MITSVDRDDLADGGAGHFRRDDHCDPAASRHHHRSSHPGFPAQAGALEICRRRQARRVQPQSGNRAAAVPEVRPGRATSSRCAAGQTSRSAIRKLSPSPALWLAGRAERRVAQVMDDLRAADVDFLTIGQYLQPTPKHHAVARLRHARRVRRLRSDGATGRGF